MSISVVGIPWYQSIEDYEGLRAIALDPEDFLPTYDEWLTKANELANHFRSKGIRVIKAYMEPHDFAEWCKINNTNIKSHSRRDFANEYAANFHNENPLS